jgi:hypothetical protein
VACECRFLPRSILPNNRDIARIIPGREDDIEPNNLQANSPKRSAVELPLRRWPVTKSWTEDKNLMLGQWGFARTKTITMANTAGLANYRLSAENFILLAQIHQRIAAPHLQERRGIREPHCRGQAATRAASVSHRTTRITISNSNGAILDTLYVP